MRTELIENNPLLKLSIAFSLEIISYCEILNLEKKYIIEKQLLRSATSIGANAMEAQNPETQYWLILCENAQGYPKPNHLLNKLEELNRILGSIISTAKRKTPLSYILSFFIF